MEYLVVAYPEFAPADLAQIQAIRQVYDPNFAIIAPHVTLVFPMHTQEPERLRAHVQACVQDLAAFVLEFRCALPMPDVLSDVTHVFLVPDAGFGQIVRLHSRLYSGVLADALRLDVPFVPHATIAACGDAQQAKRVAYGLNAQDFCFRAMIRRIVLVGFVDEQLSELASFALPVRAELDADALV
jgi:2'-5' RNA ligase